MGLVLAQGFERVQVYAGVELVRPLMRQDLKVPTYSLDGVALAGSAACFKGEC
jgi:hypothetical protein